MLISIVVPAFDAEATIRRAVDGALTQTHQELEVVLVSDDGRDYVELLTAAGIRDSRLRQVSTGKHGGGAHRARNVGLTAARGDFITFFDADDVMRPSKLECLLPLASAHGVAFDAVDVVDDNDGTLLYTALEGETQIDLPRVIASPAPLIPLMRRDCATARVDGIELADDVVANALLVDRLGPAPVVPQALCEYRVRTTSMSHSPNSAARYDEHYALILTMLPLLPLSRTNRPLARQGFIEKRELNRAFGRAESARPGLTFQHYIAALRRAF
jgi:glycosyltransferase involved in cell wall biosynthesis